MGRRSEHAVDAEVGRLVTFISLGAFRVRRYRVALFHVKHPTQGSPRRWGSEEPRGGNRITPWRPKSVRQWLPPRSRTLRTNRGRFGMFHVKHAQGSAATFGYGATPPRPRPLQPGTRSDVRKKAVRRVEKASGWSQAARDAPWLSVRTNDGRTGLTSFHGQLIAGIRGCDGMGLSSRSTSPSRSAADAIYTNFDHDCISIQMRASRSGVFFWVETTRSNSVQWVPSPVASSEAVQNPRWLRCSPLTLERSRGVQTARRECFT